MLDANVGELDAVLAGEAANLELQGLGIVAIADGGQRQAAWDGSAGRGGHGVLRGAPMDATRPSDTGESRPHQAITSWACAASSRAACDPCP